MEEESSTVGGAAPGSSRPRVARGSARPLVHDAVGRLLTGVTLDDLTAFLTVNRLAEESGLSTGAIYSAYQPSDGHGDRRRSAPQTAAREVFLSFPSSGDGLSIEIVAAMKHVVLHGSTDREIIETLTGIIGSHVEASARGESGWDYTHFALSLAVALNDREVRERLSASYEEIHAGYAELVTVILDLTERVPIDGLSVMDLTWMVVDVADAGALRVRAGPDTQDGMVARMMQVVFAATTRRRDDDDDDALRRFAFGAVVATDDERSRIADAVRRIAARSGWGEVTLTRVANLAGVDRSALVSVAPSRHHLATFAWSDVVGSVMRRARSRSELATTVQIAELVRDIADSACARRTLVASLLQARLHDGLPDSGAEEPADPMVVLLGELLAAHAGTDAGSRAVSARTAVDALLIGAAASDSSAEQLAAVLSAGLFRPDPEPDGVGGR